MTSSFAEVRELKEMRENIRHCVDSLEMCWSCQRICECEQQVVDDAAPVWLCWDCLARIRAGHGSERGTLWGAASQ